MDKPLTIKKLNEMRLDIICMELQKAFEMFGLIKKERIGRNTFTEKYFKINKTKWRTLKTMD